MKTKIIGAVATLCLVGLLSFLSGCAEVDPYIQDNDSMDLPQTRAGEEGSYYFYDHENKKVYLSLDTKYAFISLKEPMAPAAILRNDVKTTEFKSDLSSKKQKATRDRFYSELSFSKKISDEQYFQMLSDIKSQNKDAIVAPYFNDQYGSKLGLSNFFYVKLKSEKDVALLEKTATEMGSIIISQDEFMPLWYTLSVTETSELNALESANFFHESGLFSSAEPDLMAENLFYSNDTHFGNQYNLKNTGQNGGTAGVDIKAEEARKISTGSNIVVALFDSGIYLNHEDLTANKHSLSFDAVNGTSPQQIRDTHGTMVAGVIGATKDNGKGIAGVAPNSKIMSISYEDFTRINTRQLIAGGINWAWQNGAHVINCSWGHQTALSGSYITDAINLATTNGRANKGSVVVAAAGNEGSSFPVSYPASLSNVIAVGAVDRNGAVWSGSNRGSQLSVVAPGVNIWTTTSTGGYTDVYSGTSLAAPQVSGVAALMLSKYPNLTAQQVHDIITSTASRASAGLPRDNDVGHGLVNAHSALFGQVVVSGPTNPALSQNVTYSVPATLPTGVTFNGWTILQSSYIVTGGTTSRNLTIRFTAYGEYNLTANFTLSGGTTYSAYKTIVIPPPAPYIMGDLMPVPDPESLGRAVYWLEPGVSKRLFVLNPDLTAEYEWRFDAQALYISQSVPEIWINSNSPYALAPYEFYPISCRVLKDNYYSPWSTVYLYVGPYPAWAAPAPAPSAGPQEDESDEEPETPLAT